MLIILSHDNTLTRRCTSFVNLPNPEAQTHSPVGAVREPPAAPPHVIPQEKPIPQPQAPCSSTAECWSLSHTYHGNVDPPHLLFLRTKACAREGGYRNPLPNHKKHSSHHKPSSTFHRRDLSPKRRFPNRPPRSLTPSPKKNPPLTYKPLPPPQTFHPERSAPEPKNLVAGNWYSPPIFPSTGKTPQRGSVIIDSRPHFPSHKQKCTAHPLPRPTPNLPTRSVPTMAPGKENPTAGPLGASGRSR